MRRRGRAQSLAASPTLVGAVTTLIVIVAVFLAYNSNRGLPFVPVYRVSVVLPNAQRLLTNNEVRIGGSRVGIVESIEVVSDPRTGRAQAQANLKLDKSVDPLPRDTEARVRYKSAFGLKYLELTRGDGAPLPDGGRLATSHASGQVEFDDVAGTFDSRTRLALRGALDGYGTGLAARGPALNEAVRALNPLFIHLKPVADTLAAPSTGLDRFVVELDELARIVAPVSDQGAQAIADAATTFEAASDDPSALKESISAAVPLLAQGTPALRDQRPFLTGLADLARRLRPGARSLRTALPSFNSALRVGAPVLGRTPPLSGRLGAVFTELERLVAEPQTRTSLLRLGETFSSAARAAEYIAPFQTVCNYWNYFFYNFSNALSETTPAGTALRTTAMFPPGAITIPNSRYANLSIPMAPLNDTSPIPANGRFSTNPLVPGAGVFDPHVQPILHGNPYGPAVDSEGRADCQWGQSGYLLGSDPIPGQPPSVPAFASPDIPGLQGPTFTGVEREP